MRVKIFTALGLAAAMLIGPHRPVGYAHTCTPDSLIPVQGSLLTPKGSGMERFAIRDARADGLPVLPSSGVVSHVARSLDGSRLALARFNRREGESIGGSDILFTGMAGGEPSVGVQRDRAGELLTSPTWHPDGSLIFERSTVAGGAATSSIERMGGNRVVSVMVDRGIAPNVSSDGASLAYIRTDRIDRLVHRSLASGAERVLMEDPSFLALAFPRYSPDGAWIAFAAAGEPERASDGLLGAAALTLGPGVARAHGVPWDLWAVRVADGALRRLTTYYDDDPSVAWSPDGQWLALFGGESIKVFAFDGSAYYCASATGGYGGFEWISEE